MIWLILLYLISGVFGQMVPRDLPTLSVANSEATYSYTIEVTNESGNPYILDSTLPENLVFIIMGGLIGLLFIILILIYFITWLISLYKAKNQSEKYYYNKPLMFDSATSSNSSVWETKTNNSNLSQLTLNQPLNSKNRGSMFFSPTTDYLVDNPVNLNSTSTSNLNNLKDLNNKNSTVSLFEYNSSIFEWNSIENNSIPKSSPNVKRPPSQYLEDLLGDQH